LAAGTGIDKIREKDKLPTYLVGYLTKRYQKDVPGCFSNIGRFWSCTLKNKTQFEKTYRFEDDKKLRKFLGPILKHYKRQLKEWSKDKEKKYSWRYKNRSFSMWQGSEFIKNFIEEKDAVI
jgi:hypothetical protein